MKILCRMIYLAFFLLADFSANAQGTWEIIDVPTKKSLNSLFFADSLYGWIVGDSGTIIHTADGGKSWILQNSRTSNDIVSVFFLDRNLGWASSLNYSTPPFGTILLKTTNGGDEWTGTPYPDNDIFITCITYSDSLNGWMGGRPHALVKTTDGGITWTQARMDTSILAFFPVLSIRFYNGKYGYASGGMFDIAGVVWRTNDGGDLWYAIDPSEAPADEVHELYIFDSLHVMGAGGDPDFGYGVGMIRTSNGGLNWHYDELSIQGNAYDLDFRNRKEAWAPLGSRRKLIYSLDTGNTWTEIPAPGSAAISKMTFPDSLHGFAVGQNGAVLKYMPPVPGAIDQAPFPGPDGFILYQNYPNPFSTDTKIRFTVPPYAFLKKISAEVKVYSALGKEVAIPVRNIDQPGDHEITLEDSNLPSGIYYYRLYVKQPDQYGSYGTPKKMILIR